MGSDDEFVEVSDHAADRWHERRATNPGCGPVEAWNRATWVPGDHGQYADEIRWFEPAEVALLVMHDTDPPTMTTVIGADEATGALASAIERAREEL